MKNTRIVSTALMLLSAPGAVFAQAQQTGELGRRYLSGFQGARPGRNLPDMILAIVNWTLILVSVLALAYLVYGGFLYITSRGDDTQVEQAKKTIVNAIIGIVVIGLAAALVNFVAALFT